MAFEYEIITDTCSNLTKEQAEKYDIKMIGFPYIINGEPHTDDPENPTFKPKEFYELLEKKGEAKTSLINSAVLEEFFEPYLKDGKDIIYICISGGISGTYKNALLAQRNMEEKYPNRKVYIVDSLSGSYAQGILVLKTAKKRLYGMNAEEAYSYAEKLRYKIKHDFTLSDLFFMKRGGRLSGVSAFLGTLAMIKPMLTLDKNGDIKVYAKINGRKKSLSLMWENFKKNVDPDEADFIAVVYGSCENEAREFRDGIKKLFPNSELFYDYLTPLVGAHTGPSAVGILYVSKEERD